MKDLSALENFKQILDAIGDLVLVKGPNSKLLWANQTFCEYYGMSNEQLKGIVDAPFSEPDHTLQYVKDDAYVFNTGKILDIPQEPITRHDGEIRICHTVKSPIFDSEGKVIMTVGISRDITDMVKTKATIEHERGRQIYSAKMATLGEMAGDIAHEINTPLAIIDILAGQINELLSKSEVKIPKVIENCVKIEKTVKRIAKIISGLKNFSREGLNDPAIKILLKELIEETMAFSKEKFTSTDIEISLNFDDESLDLECNPTQISQVLLNIFCNARDAIISQQGQKWIHVSAKRTSDNQIEISVTDSGLGITKNLEAKIFSPFFTTKEVGKGTGLGLSISKGIIEAHHGTLFLDTSSKNTCFVIRLPRQTKTQQVRLGA
ncbi:MAG: ATP-binding protein [Oligoflexia bacterium]|nr:ATP-binding protein [Oligoflexia bacterium]